MEKGALWRLKTQRPRDREMWRPGETLVMGGTQLEGPVASWGVCGGADTHRTETKHRRYREKVAAETATR